jgi:hypothetical protein
VPKQLVDDHDAHEAELEHSRNDGLLPRRQSRGGGADHLLEHGAQRVRILHLRRLGEFGPHARRVGVKLSRPFRQGLVGEDGSEIRLP